MSSHPRTSPVARRRLALSQNFLHHTPSIRTIVHASGVRPGELVVEPGAGEGHLSHALAAATGRVIAYEIDRTLAGRFPDHPRIRLVQGDFLRATPPREPFAVVGNIPYSRTTDIVRWCLAAPRLTSATLLTQLEYARRRTGDFGSWPLLTVRSWPWYAWRLGPRVHRQHFVPVPRGDSAVLRLERRPETLLPAADLGPYGAFVDLGFTGRGGSLHATLTHHYGRRRTRALDLDRSLPCGLVPPEVWLRLYRELRCRA
ncbi:ribosomal RNA small subunit methyltransferase A [Streptomyces sp. JH002]|uniref:ribosomal RNA small subunit methyltransferase A n=1 Tax=Streptomyces sp. JH002 TaxID=2763259 RepID=UPI003D803FC7